MSLSTGAEGAGAFIEEPESPAGHESILWGVFEAASVLAYLAGVVVWKVYCPWAGAELEACCSSSGSRVGGMHFNFIRTQAPQGQGPFWRAPSQRILRLRHPSHARMTLRRLWRLYSSTKTYCFVCPVAAGACKVSICERTVHSRTLSSALP